MNFIGSLHLCLFGAHFFLTAPMMVHRSPWYGTLEPPIGVHWAVISTKAQIAEKIQAHHNLYSFRHYLIIGPT